MAGNNSNQNALIFLKQKFAHFEVNENEGVITVSQYDVKCSQYEIHQDQLSTYSHD